MTDASGPKALVLELEIGSTDKAFLETIFNEQVIAEARPIPLGESVDLRGVRWGFNKSAAAVDVATILLTAAATVPATVIANLVSAWLQKHKGSIESVTIERVEVKLDAEQRVRQVVIEKITRDTGS